MSRLLAPIALLALLTSTAHTAACTRCPISTTYTTPSHCHAVKCPEVTCTVTTTTTIPTSYCSTKTRKACPHSCAPCFTETVTEREDPAYPNTTINPGGPIIIVSTNAPSPTAQPECDPYTVTTTAANSACTFDTSKCIRAQCVIESVTTVPACGVPVTETELAVCATECPGGCATFVYTTTAGPQATSSSALD